MPRFFMTFPGFVLAAAVAMGFGWLFCWWSALHGAAMREVLVIYGGATDVALFLFLGGQPLRVTSHAFYIVIGSAVFLAVNILV